VKVARPLVYINLSILFYGYANHIIKAGGTTNRPLTYRFANDGVQYLADSVSYRLRQIDTDGSSTPTDPITVGRSDPSALPAAGHGAEPSLPAGHRPVQRPAS
jgi:hypothetical protein